MQRRLRLYMCSSVLIESSKALTRGWMSWFGTSTKRDKAATRWQISSLCSLNHALLTLTTPTTMSTNPSHILIARNSRNSNNPSAALSSPTETHAAASGIFRSGSMSLNNSAPQWLLELEECDADDAASALGSAEGDDEVELDATFTRQCRFPGTVKIVVEATTFW